MSEQGSHGGSSYSEVATPLVLLSSVWEKEETQTKQHQDWPDIIEVDQIDVAVSLCLLLGLPPPHNSLGVMIPGLLSSLSPQRQLQALHANAHQVAALFSHSISNAQEGKSVQNIS